MKTKFTLFTLFVVFALIGPSAYGQKTTKAAIKVYGNCGMCKVRIENALDQKGIKQAQWDPKTKELQVVYSNSKVTEQQIHELVAAAGHDTDKVKASDETYAELPFCCLYRDHDHSRIKDNKANH